MRWFLVTVALAACGDDGNKMTCAHPPGAFPEGDTTGHADPLHAGPSEARAGRIHGADLPLVPSGLVTWKDGDFVLANDRVALVIEDVGDSDLYDPWGGRPVGLARVVGGQLVEPANFGEFFLLTGRSSIVTDSVSVINDGSNGMPAIIRARGKLHPIPFFESVISAVYSDQFTDIDAAIDYELAPGSEKVDIRMRYASPRTEDKMVPSTLHAFMYTDRMPVFQPGAGFDKQINGAPHVDFVDDQATSWSYSPGDGTFGSSLSVSGFLGAFTTGYNLPACGTTDRIHASIVIGGPGLDGIEAAVARTNNTVQRAITGTVTRGGQPAGGVRVHASDGTSYLTRTTTAADGTFTLHVPAAANIHLDAYKRGDAVGTAEVGAGTSATIDLPATGSIHVVATENGAAVPVRVQVMPAGGQQVPSVPGKLGEDSIAAGRLHVEYAVTGDVTLPAPPGSWDVIVSRGYEYELVKKTVTVVANETVQVAAPLDHAVDTTGIQCGDFHVHTWRSNDSGDRALQKVAQAVADGLELPVRSDHEWVGDFAQEIAQLGVQAFAFPIGSIELTSFEVWGHMGVFPLQGDPTAVNNGAPKWQTFPTAAAPDTKFETLSPPKVFDAVRARPEQPIVIINHPHSGVNYFPYVGYDPATGTATGTEDWDTKFTLVEVFNNSSWSDNRTGTVDDWFGMLKAGRKVFAVGSSDSHGIVGSPVGYPRTCVQLGTDDPRQLTASLVRDQLAAGHATVSGGIYVTAKLGTAGPGDTTTGAGSPQMVDVTVQAPTWIDVSSIDVVVDGTTVDTIPVMPGDADPQNPAIRWHGQVPVMVRASGGFVVIAASGTQPLEPVHPGEKPFGVTNPIFVTP
ncbi:MAG: CehA/McbA family metallohydrolase [Deltaproteobacteria bacterium]|nr:CehA/McbA family metallohydrolase [Deltaproteobacteria bacterium]